MGSCIYSLSLVGILVGTVWNSGRFIQSARNFIEKELFIACLSIDAAATTNRPFRSFLPIRQNGWRQADLLGIFPTLYKQG